MSLQFRLALVAIALVLIGVTVFGVYKGGQKTSQKQNPVSGSQNQDINTPASENKNPNSDIGTPTSDSELPPLPPTINSTTPNLKPLVSGFQIPSSNPEEFIKQLAPLLYTYSYDNPDSFRAILKPYIASGRYDEVINQVGPPDLIDGASSYPGRRSIARLDTLSTVKVDDQSTSYLVTLKVVEAEGQNLISRDRYTLNILLTKESDGWKFDGIGFE